MVLKALRDLYAKVTSPVIRACLESAYDDIAHLVGTGQGSASSPDSRSFT